MRHIERGFNKQPHGRWRRLACAEALVDQVMPAAQQDHESPYCILIGGKRRLFSEKISTFLVKKTSARAN